MLPRLYRPGDRDCGICFVETKGGTWLPPEAGIGQMREVARAEKVLDIGLRDR